MTPNHKTNAVRINALCFALFLSCCPHCNEVWVAFSVHDDEGKCRFLAGNLYFFYLVLLRLNFLKTKSQSMSENLSW